MLLGASFDDAAANAAFAKKHELPFALLCDTDKSLALAYGAAKDAKAGYPSRVTVVIGADGKIERVYPRVSPKDHPSEVLADLTRPPK